jgi:hypothetical protein
MVKKVMNVKDWKLSKEGKQFVFISNMSVRRLKDGMIFTLGEKYIHDSSSYPEFIVLWEITEFNEDQVKIEFIVNAYGTQSYCQYCEINSIQKGTTDDGKVVVRVKHKTISRKRTTAKR